MADENGSVVNPLSSGNDGHSVETAAVDFTEMLKDEGRKPRREQDRKPASQSPEPSDDAATRDEGQSRRQPRGERQEPAEGDADALRDPILDDAPTGDAKDKEGPDSDDASDEQDGDEPDDQDGDDEPDDEDGEDPLDAEHEITVNGKKETVTVREALAGYQKEADYRQGTERNAREYEEIQDFARETVETRQRTDATLQEALDLIEALKPTQEDWDAMERADPPGFIRAQKHWAGLIEKAKGIGEARNALLADQQAETQRGTSRYFQTQERELLNKFPALRDEKKANAFRSDIMEYGKANGFTEQELIDGATDHRAQIALYKAAQYDKIRASKSAAGRAASTKGPKNSAESRPRAPARNEARNASRDADRRLQRTGSLQDAAASFAALVRSER